MNADAFCPACGSLMPVKCGTRICPEHGPRVVAEAAKGKPTRKPKPKAKR